MMNLLKQVHSQFHEVKEASCKLYLQECSRFDNMICVGGQTVLQMLLSDARFEGVTIAAASSTTEPEWAQAVMALMEVANGVKMEEMFSYNQIYPIHNKVSCNPRFKLTNAVLVVKKRLHTYRPSFAAQCRACA